MKIGIIAVPLLGLGASLSAADLHPIVEVKTGYFFGAASDSKWIKAAPASKALEEKIEYRVYGLTEQLGQTTSHRPAAAAEDVCPDNFSVELNPRPEKGAIALAANWNALPRIPRVGDVTQEVYLKAVGDFLRQRGIRDPKVKITRIVHVDLDGDGEDEALISATNFLSEDEEVMLHSPAAGSYSIVLLRRVVAGKVQTQLIAGEIHRKAEPTTANVYEISAVLDLNGDGKLEVVVHSEYYEGGATTIYQCEPSKIKALLEVACGV